MPQVFPFDKKTENEDQRPRGNLEPRILESGLETHSPMGLTNYKLTTRTQVFRTQVFHKLSNKFNNNT